MTIIIEPSGMTAAGLRAAAESLERMAARAEKREQRQFEEQWPSWMPRHYMEAARRAAMPVDKSRAGWAKFIEWCRNTFPVSDEDLYWEVCNAFRVPREIRERAHEIMEARGAPIRASVWTYLLSIIFYSFHVFDDWQQEVA